MRLSTVYLATLALTYGAPIVAREVDDTSSLAGISHKYNIDTSKLQIPEANHESKRLVSIGDAIKSSQTNTAQTMDTLKKQLDSNDGHAGKDMVTAAITGLDSQVDILGGMILKDLSPVTLGLTGDLADFLLGPVFQGLTNGIEVVLSNVIGGSIDIVTDGTAQLVTKSLATMKQISNKLQASNSVTSSINKLQNTVNSLPKTSQSSKGKRTVTIAEDVKSSIMNLKQTVETMKTDLTSKSGHVGQDVVIAAITGLDSQVDILGGTILKDLSPVTLGLTGDLGDFLLGPVFQGLTNGVEVIVSNVIGGSYDIVADGTSALLSKSLSTVKQIATKLNAKADTITSIDNAISDVANLPSKSASTPK